MAFLYALAGLVAMALFIYLVVVLIKPDLF